MFFQQFGYSDVGGDAEAGTLERMHEGDCGNSLSKAQSARAKQSRGQVQRCRPARGGQREAAGITQLQGFSLQKPIRIGADAPHLRQRFGIGADQDVLPVIERDTFGIDASCPTAEGT